MAHVHPTQSDSEDSRNERRRLGRRGLIAFSGAAAAGGVTLALPSSAEAATGTTAWKLGGNPGVSTDGTNFLGPTNTAPLIFKTKPTNGTKPVERMRIAPGGRIGIGTTAPTAWTQVVSKTAPIALQGTSMDATSSAVGVQGDSASNVGVLGNGGYTGLSGNGGPYGCIAQGSSVGVYGSGGSYGTYGAGGTYGVFGSGSTYGVYGSSSTGVYGVGSNNGVVGTTSNPNAAAVYGTGGQYGVQGASGRTAGVRGDSGYVGTWGQGTTYGVYGLATDTVNAGYGVFGQASGGAGSFAIYSNGNLAVNGTLSKNAGSFKIDHPLDPEEKWLYHSFVESPDMMNVYNGNVVLDAGGEATIELPHYFSALNKDFRYQLTTIGAHAPVFVKTEIADNRFTIGGGHRGLKVSWQVTGIRHDDYADAHRIPVEQDKTEAERGTRSFVPKGSKAKLMQVGPAHTPQPENRFPTPPDLAPLR